MKKTMKRNVVLSSILAIVLCVSLIAGGTFALFTSESKVNIAVTSGKVKVEANIDETSVYTKEYRQDYALGDDHMYEAEALFGEDGLTVKKMVPGDGIKFNIVVKNLSNVTVKYRTIIGCEDDGLLEGLNVSIDGETYNGATKISNYESLSVGSEDKTVSVEIELPETAEDVYQDKTLNLTYKVEAVQGNADVSDPDGDTIYIYNINDLLAFNPTRNLGNGYGSYKLEIVNDIDMSTWTNSLNIDYISVEIEGNNHVLSNMRAALFAKSSNNTLTVKNVKFDHAQINESATGNTAGAIIVNYVNSNGDHHNIDISNCHVTNSNVYAYKWAGAFIGAEANYRGTYTITNCTVEDSTISTTDSSVGAFLGYVMSETTLKNCKVLGNTTVSCADDRSGKDAVAGALVGTVGVGSGGVATTHIYNCTVGADVMVENLNAAPIANGLVGRLVLGQLEIDGTAYCATSAYLANALTATKKDINVVLTSDIAAPINTLGQYIGGSGHYRLGGDATEKINIDLNGHKLTLTTTQWSGLGAKNSAAVITVKNGSMNSTGNSATTWNAYDLTFFDCEWKFDSVTFDKPVAVSTAADVSMYNVAINVTTGDYYALWITADAAKVALEKVTIDSTGRAIAIKDQYVAATNRTAVQLSLKDCEITSVKKAAVLVTNTAGAVISAENVDISNVTQDSVNLVWCDKAGVTEAGYDYPSTFDDITVSGCSKIVEP